MSELVQTFIFFWAVIDPIGSIPIFLAVTRGCEAAVYRRIALKAVAIAAGILLFFIVAGQFLLDAMQVPLVAFQISGGIIMFAFAFTMIFGESKPDEELKLIKNHSETAVFPLAVPAIAGPGAMMAVVLMTDNHRFDVMHQLSTTGILLSVLVLQLILFFAARPIGKILGTAGASVISRVMGIILASVAMTSILAGIRTYFQL